ncbi:hypothetical protein ACJMK2_005288 [Sinanodonta woodiana]|uniref:Microtubule-associated protein 9 n=1 Tax=Sinanodonta woodiana TaxID=1069815 RepID=A0ABD3VQ60_SINWO
MDEVDAPLSVRRQKPKSRFQVELDAKMRERRSKGLAADISEESEPLEDEDDEEEESDEDFLSQYRSTLKTRPDRPSSAKRRQDPPSLGDTLRPGEAAKWMKKTDDTKQKTIKENVPPVKVASPKSSLNEKPMTKEELLFGRKTPTNEMKNKDQSWLPPSFQRSSPTLEQITTPGNRKQSPGARSQSPHDFTSSIGGRKTPQDQLQTISEGLTPGVRPRFSSPTDRTNSRESTPRTLSVSSSPRSDQQTPRITPRIKPKTDLFGKTEQVEVNLESDDEKKNTAARNRRRFPDSKVQERKDPFSKDSSLPGERKTPTRRQTPPGQQMPPGRKTPTEQQTPNGRQTPAERLTPGQKLGRKTPDIETKKETEDEKKRFTKEPSVLDFLQEGVKPEKKKTPSRFDKKEREKPLQKSESNDSITEELVPSKSLKQQKSPAFDRAGSESSLCDEIEKDLIIAREPEKPTSQKSSKQRSETEANENAIRTVEDAQNKTSLLKLIQPEDKKKKRSQDDSDIKRPKPRHSLPESEKSSKTNLETAAFNSTMSIRQAIYEEWRREKKKKTLKELEEKRKNEAELEMKKKKEKEDKIIENQATFRTWMEQKQELLKQQAKEKRKKEKEAEDDKKKKEEEKINEAEKNFKIWKQRKDEIIQENIKKQQEEQKKKEKDMMTTKKDKEKDNETAFMTWKKTKDQKLIEQHTKKYQEHKEVKQKVAVKEEMKEIDANQKYEEWMRKKEEQEAKERERKRKLKRLQEMGELYIPAWSPPNRTIPFGR